MRNWPTEKLPLYFSVTATVDAEVPPTLVPSTIYMSVELIPEGVVPEPFKAVFHNVVALELQAVAF